MNKLDKIRQAEKESHIETYTTNELFQQGTWLQKPVKNGVVCLVVNSEVSEIDKNSGKVLEPQFEINISANEMQVFLGEMLEN